MSRERAPSIFEAGYYDRLRRIERCHGWSRGMRRAMRALLSGPLPDRVVVRAVDVGCGAGVLLEELRTWPPAELAVGIDVSDEALRHARDRGAGRRLLRADAAALPLRSSGFDLVLSVDVVQHISPQAVERSLAECARLLRPGGILFLRANARCGHRPLKGVDPNRYRRYDRRELEALARASGLEVVRSTYLNALPGLWASLVERLRESKVHPPEGPPLTIRPRPRGLAWVDRILDVLLATEAWLVRRGVDLPFGHSTALVARRSSLDHPSGAS